MGRSGRKYFADLIEGAAIQINVIRALYYREILTRINKTGFGILGLYYEPLGNILVL